MVKKKKGLLRFDASQNLTFEEKKGTAGKAKKTEMPTCPKCKKGKIIKGKTAYGCSDWKSGCDFRFPFEDIFKKANGKKLTKALVMKIISS